MKTRPPWALLWLALAVAAIAAGLVLAVATWPSPPGPVWVPPSPLPQVAVTPPAGPGGR